MKVYVLSVDTDWNDFYVRGVYATLDAAQAAVPEWVTNTGWDQSLIGEHRQWTTTGSGYSGPGPAVVEEFDVIEPVR